MISARRRATRGLAIAAVVTAAFAARASAQNAEGVPLVLLLGSENDPAAAESSSPLHDALRIQLTGIAEVRAGPTLHEAGLARNVERATDLLEESGAALAVWLERPEPTGDPETTVVLYVVGRQRDLALVRVARVSGRSGPELDRSLALTVAELLDSVLALRASEPTPGRAMTRAFSRAAARQDRERRERALEREPVERWKLAVELGGGVLLGTGTTTASGAGLAGAALRLDAAYAIVEVGAAFHLLSRIGAEQRDSSVELDELALSIGAQALARAGQLAAGGYLHAGCRYVEARGRSSDGRSGAAAHLLPALWMGAEGRWMPLRGLEVRLALGVETTAIAQRYAVAGEPVLDLGVVRPTGSLSLVLSAP